MLRLRALGRTAAVVALSAVVGIGVAALALVPGAAIVDDRLFDLAVTLNPPEPPDDVVIVAIDEPSFADVGRQWPWPRSLHGELVTALRAAGAKVIGLDLIFAEPSSPDEDAALAAALGPDVVLAADEALIETPHADQLVRSEPLPVLSASGAVTGLASVTLDADGVLRHIPPYDEAFARKILDVAGIAGEEAPPGALMRPFGPARTLPTVSYYQALDPQAFLPPDFLRERIVVVGLSLQATASVEAGGADAFATSFTTRTRRLVPGVEVQASILENLRRGLAVRPLSEGAALAATLGAALAAGGLVRRRTGRTTAVAALLGLLGAGAGSLALLYGLDLWVSPAAPLLAFLMVLGLQSALDYAAERRMRRMVTRAFGHYLAPELVERLARDPSALKLGGERRRLTLLFCDVRGFTSISERLKDDPERLTGLINRLLDPLSAEVFKRGGTIDKYIGDCVMAFWNAPLDDPDHARHAVETALGMVEAARLFDERLRAEPGPGGEPLPRIAVGVGLNTGDVVVGNMGSSARFDYTALGDAVNLASRLEGLCKTYAVPIVIGEATRLELAEAVTTLPLDRIAVRGRQGAEWIHTVPIGPQPDPDTARLHRSFVAELAEGGVPADDPRFGVLSAAIPCLAAFYATRRAAIAGS